MNIRFVVPLFFCAALMAWPGWVQEATADRDGPLHGRGDPARRAGRFFHSLSPEQQERFFKLLEEWSSLPADQREAILQRFAQLRDMKSEQMEMLRRSLERFEQMPEEQRQRIRAHVDKWQNLPPEQREKLRTRERELRRKAEEDLSRRLQELGVQPEPEQMRWIRQYYFQLRREVFQQVFQRARELKAQLPPDATDDEKQQLRPQLQQYRQELEAEAMEKFEAFAKNPHPLPPPEHFKSDRPPRRPRRLAPAGSVDGNL